ncbi:hypothetical protein IEQ34_025803 [Dendrobium chrysotoxum]|uniref:Uncharacterized protein n=1 Tax=Dendrobium chrysotoxum TaxID=161865 RepID=A0AAV7FNT9_DENCH|nr:hypothetical protein IEQ34_025803 [Dendrobium chrysotoxum]
MGRGQAVRQRVLVPLLGEGSMDNLERSVEDPYEEKTSYTFLGGHFLSTSIPMSQSLQLMFDPEEKEEIFEKKSAQPTGTVYDILRKAEFFKEFRVSFDKKETTGSRVPEQETMAPTHFMKPVRLLIRIEDSTHAQRGFRHSCIKTIQLEHKGRVPRQVSSRLARVA